LTSGEELLGGCPGDARSKTNVKAFDKSRGERSKRPLKGRRKRTDRGFQDQTKRVKKHGVNSTTDILQGKNKKGTGGGGGGKT